MKATLAILAAAFLAGCSTVVYHTATLAPIIKPYTKTDDPRWNYNEWVNEFAPHTKD